MSFYNYNGIFVPTEETDSPTLVQPNIVAENIRLKKELKHLKRKCEAYKPYVPRELLTD